MGGSWSTRREPTHTRGEHANSTQKGPSQELNLEPSCCEATVLTTTPPCSPNSKSIGQIRIKCGIYQGYVLSLLLLYVGLNPLSQIITKTGYGYRFWSGATISHLLYIDDTKLYVRAERDINSLIHLIRIYSKNIGSNIGKSSTLRV